MSQTRPSNTTTAALADFVARADIASLPPEVIEHTKLDMLDTIGCGLFGRTLPIADVLESAYRGEFTGGSGAQIWGTDWQTSAETAALVNGTQVHSFELDDLHAEAILHPGGVSLPAVLALAGPGTTGADVVVAHALGLEVGCRLGLTLGVRMLKNGWHNNGVLGAVAASAAAARVLRLGVDRTLHAFGIGGSLASGLMAAQYGSMVKRLHAGHAAQNGVKAARLARAGLTGITALLEEPYGGYASAFAGGQVRLGEITDELGESWHLLDVGFKPYAACGSSHTAIDVALQIREEMPDIADHIRGIEVGCSSITLDHVGWAYVPDSVTTAQMNLPYAMAAALLLGRVGVEEFTQDRIHDGRIIALARRITCTARPDIDARGRSHRHEIDVSVDLTDGRSLGRHKVSAYGSAAEPMAVADVQAKFMSLASHVLTSSSAAELQDIVLGLECNESAGPLLDALRVSSIPRQPHQTAATGRANFSSRRGLGGRR